MAIDDLIKSSNKLIYKIAGMFYGVDMDDLYQAGVLGLLKAYKNYKDNKDTKFSSYAYDYIYGEMYNLVNNKIIKVNRDILKLFKMIEKTRSALSQKYHKIPTYEQVAEFLEMPLEKVNEAVMAGMEIMSLDNEKEHPLYDTLTCKENVSTDDKILIDESLEMLSSDERNIIKARFYEDLTQSEVAKKLAMTQVMVSRYEKKGLMKMQEFMRM